MHWWFVGDLCICLALEIYFNSSSIDVWEPCQTSKMELLAKTVNGIQPLTIFPKVPS